MNNIKKHIKIRTLYLVSVLALVSLYSCVPTKNVREENKTVPEQYKSQTEDTTNTANIQWKDFFKDPNLVALIDTALVKNQELNMMLQQVSCLTKHCLSRVVKVCSDPKHSPYSQ